MEYHWMSTLYRMMELLSPSISWTNFHSHGSFQSFLKFCRFRFGLKVMRYERADLLPPRNSRATTVTQLVLTGWCNLYAFHSELQHFQGRLWFSGQGSLKPSSLKPFNSVFARVLRPHGYHRAWTMHFFSLIWCFQTHPVICNESVARFYVTAWTGALFELN